MNSPTPNNLAELIANECMAYHRIDLNGFAASKLPTAAEYADAIETHAEAISSELLSIIPANKLADKIAVTAVGVGASGYNELYNYNGSLSPDDDSFDEWLKIRARDARRFAEAEAMRSVKRLLERLAPEEYEPSDSDLAAIAAAAGEIAERLYRTTAEIAWNEICSACARTRCIRFSS